MVTTIQISDGTKKRLSKLKNAQRKTYDDIVSELLSYEERLRLREEAARYYSKHAQEDLAEVQQWAHTETEL